jgi:Rap1a immunity proteins
MRASVVCAGLLLALTGEAVGAGVTSANTVMPGCRAFIAHPDEYYLQGYCMGAVAAIIRVDPSTCPPKDSTIGQGVRVVVKYIDSRPERLHEDFNDLAAEALRIAWPCPAQ